MKNGLYVTLDYERDYEVTNLAVRLAAEKINVSYFHMLRLVLGEDKYIKECIYNDDELVKELEINFNKKMEWYLNEMDSSLKTADEDKIRKALMYMQLDYRNDMRLLLFSTFKEKLINSIIDYYNSHTDEKQRHYLVNNEIKWL